MTHSRPLSLVENFNRLRNASTLYRNFQIAATYAEPITHRQLFNALRKAVLEYHMFVCNVFRVNGEFCYKPLDKITLGDVLEVKDESYLTDGLVNETFMREVDTIKFEHSVQKPLFRLILIGDRTLSSVFEHTIADGMAGAMFHEILAEKLALEEPDTTPIDLTSEFFNYQNDKLLIKEGLTDPIDNFLEDYNEDYTFGDSNYYDREKPNSLERWPGTCKAALHDTTAYKLMRFSPDETAQILKSCKLHGVLFTCFIVQVFAITLRPIIGDGYFSSHKVAINMRRHIPQQTERKIIATMAHVGVSQSLPPVTEFSWDAARKFQVDLKKTLDNKRIFNQVALLFDGFLADPESSHTDYFHGGLGKPRADTTKTSNLGLIRAQGLLQFVFSQTLPSTAGEFLLNIASTKEGMNMVLVYFDNNDFGDIAETLKKNLLKFSQH